jgi:hypothetical protein
MDSEGYWLSEGIRLNDEEYGRELLEGLRVDERGRFFTDTDGQPVLIEAFDEPLVVRMIERNGDAFTARFPYGFEQTLDLSALVVDEWDRFHGRTATGVPFVMSRPAQAAFFNLVDEYDDESVTVSGQRHVLGPWLQPLTEVETHDFWSSRFGTEKAGWELGRETPILPEILPQLKLPRARVLVLGTGSGHDSAFFARAGHLVTGVDFSPVAIEIANKNYGSLPDLKFVHADAFNLPANFAGAFDVVVEHTLYCAVSPERRSDLVKVWRKCLTEQGHLLGIFWVRDKRDGPPWGGSEWEVRERLRHGFDFRYWTRWRRSIESRQGAELVVWAQKK